MKLTIKSLPPYAEEGQSNPLRWAILSGSPSVGFVNESAWLKCKDFFNDYAVAYNGGQRFKIYGFSTEGMIIPKQGEPVYMAISYLTKEFLDNLTVINKSLPEAITLNDTEQEDVKIIEIPAYYFANTYRISLLSLIIRLINVPHKFTSWDEFVSFPNFIGGEDQSKWKQVADKKVFFNTPKLVDEYIWYCGKDHNNKKEVPLYQMTNLVHNNGCLGWGQYF